MNTNEQRRIDRVEKARMAGRRRCEQILEAETASFVNEFARLIGWPTGEFSIAFSEGSAQADAAFFFGLTPCYCFHVEIHDGLDGFYLRVLGSWFKSGGREARMRMFDQLSRDMNSKVSAHKA